MPKKTKKSEGKSEEEQLMQLQQRAQAEEEMNKKKEQMFILFLKDKLQKEQRNTAVNLLKLNEGWRTILRSAKDAELRKNITVLRQTFEWTLDHLDSIIGKLVGDLQEAERREVQVQQSHRQHMETLQTLQTKRLQCLQQQWERHLQDLSTSFSFERQQMLDLSLEQDDRWKDFMLSVDQQDEDTMRELQKLYKDCLEKYTVDMNAQMIAMQTMDEVNTSQRSLEGLQFSSRTSEELDLLLAKSQQQINDDLKTLRKLEENVHRLRDLLTVDNAENCLTEEGQKANIDEMRRERHKLRDQLDQMKKMVKKQLTLLAVQGQNTTKNLEAVITKGERVLRLADYCCKLERKLDGSSLSRRAEDSAQDGKASAEVGWFPELQQLQQRIGSALWRRHALREKKKDLKQENQQLRLLLQQHDTHGHPALLHVAPAPTAHAPQAAVDRRHIPVVEAAHAVLKQ